MFENDISWPVLSTKSNCMEGIWPTTISKSGLNAWWSVRVVNAHHNPINYVAKDDPSMAKTACSRIGCMKNLIWKNYTRDLFCPMILVYYFQIRFLHEAIPIACSILHIGIIFSHIISRIAMSVWSNTIFSDQTVVLLLTI